MIRRLIPLLACAAVSVFSQTGEELPFAVVKSLKGGVELMHFTDSSTKELKLFAMIPSEVRITTGPKAELEMRLFAGDGSLEMGNSSTLELGYGEVRGKEKAVMRLAVGECVLSLSSGVAAGMSIQSENTLISPRASRWQMKVNSEGKTTLVVVKGEMVVYNRPKDETAMVTAGKICYSDEDGLKIIDAQEKDLLLFKENFLEIDFINSQSGQTKTLEIEYESGF
jgi:hypothetical protein